LPPGIIEKAAKQVGVDFMAIDEEKKHQLSQILNKTKKEKEHYNLR
jgi:hypothetical protein